MSDPIFLTLDEILAIHADQIRQYGGVSGIRERSLLGSAMGMPETTFDGEYLHGNRFEMAAESKRTALMSAVVFLGLNDQRLTAKADSLYQLVDGVAGERFDKSTVAVFLRDHCRNR